jgi:hypothetical protein
MPSSRRDWGSRSLVSRASEARTSSARAERDPGHESGLRRDASPPIPIHLSNSPSQRFTGPLNLARGRRVSLFLLPDGERSAETAQTCRACEARPTTLLRRGASLAIGTPASRRSTVAISDPGPLFLNRAASGRPTNAASSSRPGRSARRAGPRRLPSLQVQAAAAGATPRSASRLASGRRPSPSGDNSYYRIGIFCQWGCEPRRGAFRKRLI